MRNADINLPCRRCRRQLFRRLFISFEFFFSPRLSFDIDSKSSEVSLLDLYMLLLRLDSLRTAANHCLKV